MLLKQENEVSALKLESRQNILDYNLLACLLFERMANRTMMHVSLILILAHEKLTSELVY
jgi:hypothetical protein